MTSGLGPVVPSLRLDACIQQSPVRRARGSCRACVEACSEGALALNPLRIDSAACTGCDLCAPACPTAALELSGRSKARRVTAWRSINAGAPFEVGCERARDAVEGVPRLTLRCLAAAGWETMLLPVLLGASEVHLLAGLCKGCPHESAMNTIDGRRDLAAVAARAAGVGAIGTVSHAPRQLEDSVLSRRALFRALLGREAVGEGAAELDYVMSGMDCSDGLQALWERRLVVELLQLCRPVRTPAPAYVGLPKVDAGRCDECGLCAVACPTGALSRANDPAEAGLLWLSARDCTACRQCVRACEPGAVALDAVLDSSALCAREPMCLLRRADVLCPECGGRALGPLVPFCTTCFRSLPPHRRLAIARPWPGSRPANEDRTRPRTDAGAEVV